MPPKKTQIEKIILPGIFKYRETFDLTLFKNKTVKKCVYGLLCERLWYASRAGPEQVSVN